MVQRENTTEAKELVQGKYLINRLTLGRRSGKVNMTRGYMIDNIGYSIFLLIRTMGLLIENHLEMWMVHFIETIRIGKMPIDWAMILNDSLDEQQIFVNSSPYFYMTSYIVYNLMD